MCLCLAAPPSEPGPSGAGGGWGQDLPDPRRSETSPQDFQDWGKLERRGTNSLINPLFFLWDQVFQSKYPAPLSAWIQVLFWGLRDLKRVQLFEIERPLVRVECSGKTLESEEIEDYKNQSNFKDMVRYLDVVRIKQFVQDKTTADMEMLMITKNRNDTRLNQD